MTVNNNNNNTQKKTAEDSKIAMSVNKNHKKKTTLDEKDLPKHLQWGINPDNLPETKSMLPDKLFPEETLMQRTARLKKQNTARPPWRITIFLARVGQFADNFFRTTAKKFINFFEADVEEYIVPYVWLLCVLYCVCSLVYAFEPSITIDFNIISPVKWWNDNGFFTKLKFLYKNIHIPYIFLAMFLLMIITGRRIILDMYFFSKVGIFVGTCIKNLYQGEEYLYRKKYFVIRRYLEQSEIQNKVNEIIDSFKFKTTGCKDAVVAQVHENMEKFSNIYRLSGSEGAEAPVRTFIDNAIVNFDKNVVVEVVKEVTTNPGTWDIFANTAIGMVFVTVIMYGIYKYS